MLLAYVYVDFLSGDGELGKKAIERKSGIVDGGLDSAGGNAGIARIFVCHSPCFD
jgi:hypothetical protein